MPTIRKRRRHTLDFKNKVVDYYISLPEEEKSYYQVGKLFNIDNKSVKEWVSLKKEGNLYIQRGVLPSLEEFKKLIIKNPSMRIKELEKIFSVKTSSIARLTRRAGVIWSQKKMQWVSRN